MVVRQIHSDWTERNIMNIFKKEDPGNYKPVSFTSIPSKTTDQILLEDMSKHMEDSEMTA